MARAALGSIALAVLTLPLYPSGWRAALAAADAAAAIAALLGGVVALGIWRDARLVSLATMAAVGIAVLGWLAPALGWAEAAWQSILGNAALGVPVVAALGAAGLRPIRPPVLRALGACGGSPAVIFRRVIVPRMAPAIAAGAGLAYLVSLIRDQLASVMDARGVAIATLPVLLASGLIAAAALSLGDHRR